MESEVQGEEGEEEPRDPEEVRQEEEEELERQRGAKKLWNRGVATVPDKEPPTHEAKALIVPNSKE